MIDDEKHLKTVLRHISHVQQNCEKLAERILEKNPGEFSFCRQLIANSQVHDNSKFYGAEWLYLRDDVKEREPKLFQAAIVGHVHGNSHHPEFWGGIEYMPRVFVAEMLCDWKSRSEEFGSDLRTWIKEDATKRFGFTTKSGVYKQIKFFVDLLLDSPFK